MPDAYMQYDPNDGADRLFRWHGGPYIEAGFPNSGEEWEAIDAKNVWDYVADSPQIDRTLEAFQAACDEWIASEEEEG